MACTGAGVRYYGLRDVIFEHGVLLGPSEKEDLPFSKCAPNSETKFPCVILFAREFMAFKLDYEDTKQKLSECEKKQ